MANYKINKKTVTITLNPSNTTVVQQVAALTNVIQSTIEKVVGPMTNINLVVAQKSIRTKNSIPYVATYTVNADITPISLTNLDKVKANSILDMIFEFINGISFASLINFELKKIFPDSAIIDVIVSEKSFHETKMDVHTIPVNITKVNTNDIAFTVIKGNDEDFNSVVVINKLIPAGATASFKLVNEVITAIGNGVSDFELNLIIKNKLGLFSTEFDTNAGTFVIKNNNVVVTDGIDYFGQPQGAKVGQSNLITMEYLNPDDNFLALAMSEYSSCNTLGKIVRFAIASEIEYSHENCSRECSISYINNTGADIPAGTFKFDVSLTKKVRD